MISNDMNRECTDKIGLVVDMQMYNLQSDAVLLIPIVWLDILVKWIIWIWDHYKDLPMAWQHNCFDISNILQWSPCGILVQSKAILSSQLNFVGNVINEIVL